MHKLFKIIFAAWLAVSVFSLCCYFAEEETEEITPAQALLDDSDFTTVVKTEIYDPAKILTDIDLGKGKDVVPELIEALGDEDSEVRAAACIALAEIGLDAQAAITSLINSLSDDESEVIGSAALALGYIGGPEVEKAVPLLLNALKHDDIFVSGSASVALERIGISSRQAMTVVDMLQGENPTIRIFAARALNGIGPDAVSVLPALIEALEDNYPNVRFLACNAIAKLGANAKSALPKLRELAAKDPSLLPGGGFYVRWAAEKAIAKIEGTWVEDSESNNSVEDD